MAINLKIGPEKRRKGVIDLAKGKPFTYTVDGKK